MIFELQDEWWSPVKEYEGLYEVSVYGRVKSLAKTVMCGHKKQQSNKTQEKILSVIPAGKDRYLTVMLSKNGVSKRVKVHRLVAEAFIPNPENKPFVNHKDFNVSNNTIANLEWCTQSENMMHSSKNGRLNRIGNVNYPHKKVLCIETGTVFNGLHECERSMGISWQNISKVCRGIRKTAGGHSFKYL